MNVRTKFVILQPCAQTLQDHSSVSVHLDLQETQDPNAAKSREENAITMMNVLTIQHVLNTNALIHVEFPNRVGKEHYVRQLHIEPYVAVHQPGVGIHTKNASNMNVS